MPLPPQRADREGGASWADRFTAWRESLTARPRFRAWAARFPLTRPLARRRARELFDLCAGFVYSQVLAACVRLKLFEALHEQGLTLIMVTHDDRIAGRCERVVRLRDGSIESDRAGGRVASAGNPA